MAVSPRANGDPWIQQFVPPCTSVLKHVYLGCPFPSYSTVWLGLQIDLGGDDWLAGKKVLLIYFRRHVRRGKSLRATKASLIGHKVCFPTPGRCIRLVCCPSQHDWCLIKGTAGADIHRTLIREARIFFLIYNFCKHLASSPISKTSLSSTTSSTSSTSPNFAQPCISYNLYNFYILCATLHLLSALPFTSYTGR